MEGDSRASIEPLMSTSFNPRLPDGGRRRASTHPTKFECFNPRLPDGGRPNTLGSLPANISFNPRLPDGGRRIFLASRFVTSRFNPRLPDGGRPPRPRPVTTFSLFQSTPPGWRATRVAGHHWIWWQFQSTPPGWRATGYSYSGRAVITVSIHASRMEGDMRSCSSMATIAFQSTPPGWRATNSRRSSARFPYCFNPRLPDGGRPRPQPRRPT